MTAWTKGLVASLLFVLVFVFVWLKWGTKISPENYATSVDTLDRLEKDGATDFELPDFDQKKFRLSQFKGKIVVLNFWATWCAPCVTEFPSMIRMADQLKDEVVLVTVAADERAEDVLAFIRAFKGNRTNIIHLWDPTTEVARTFGTVKLPETYIFKKDLRLAKKVVNSLEWDQADVVTYLKGIQ